MAQNRPDSYEYNPWFKLYSAGVLGGSLRFDCTPEERSVFVDFLCLANESRNRGWIQASKESSYPRTWLANHLNIDMELLERCLLKFEDQGRITNDERGIFLTSFSYYQGLNTRKRGRPTKNPDHRDPAPQAPLQPPEQNYVLVLRLAVREFKKEHDREPDIIEEHRLRLQASEDTGYRLKENRYMVRVQELAEAFESKHGRHPNDTERVSIQRQATEETGFAPEQEQ